MSMLHVQNPSHLGRYWWWNNILCASSPATPMWSTCIFLGSEMFTIQETRTLSRRIRRNKECCRWDNGPMCKSPISTGCGPQNITVITSQESHYWNAFLIGFTKTHFIHPPNYGYWDVSYIVGKVWMRRLQHCWNCRKQFSSGGESPGTSLANVNLRGGIDSRSLSRPLGGLNCDVWLPRMLP